MLNALEFPRDLKSYFLIMGIAGLGELGYAGRRTDLQSGSRQ